MSGPTLAIDFGTSNTAAAILEAGVPKPIMLGGESSMPTTVFFDALNRKVHYGNQANRMMLDGEAGRYMKALKSVLGTPLMHETRILNGQPMTFVDIIGNLLAFVRREAESQLGQPITRALSGRPVKFHSDDEARNAAAAEDLVACYLHAGFESVDFLPEPEAAARCVQQDIPLSGKGLVVDIGGGTSDFTVFSVQDGDIAIHLSEGIRLGGTDFDRELSLNHVMPELGHGSTLKRAMVEGELPMPASLFVELATWERIPQLYNTQTRAEVDDWHAMATEPHKLARLQSVLEEELGHDIAAQVEAAKIKANVPDAASSIDLSLIEADLTIGLSYEQLSESLASCERRMQKVLAAIAEEHPDVSDVLLVGGSSLMDMVQRQVGQHFSAAKIQRHNVFAAVVEGLAYGTA